jgi:Flp pilus assembly protein TadG
MRTRKGSISLEAALLLPILVTLVLGVFEWAQVQQQQARLQELATDAVMAGAKATEAQSTTASSYASTRLSSENFSNPSVQVSELSTAVGQVLELDIIVPYQSLFGTIQTPVNLRANAVMRLEYQ